MDAWIYMDHAATTPVDAEVLGAMMPYFTDRYGNPASQTHAFGWEAEEGIEGARAEVARTVGVTPREVVFTSGATEANNLALKGVFRAYRTKGNHIVTSAIEHKAILDVCASLEREGAEVTRLPVDTAGFVDPEAVRDAIRETTVLVTVMHANNEIGTIQDLPAIGRICKERGVLFHTDAAQSAGKIDLDAEALGVDLVSISAHKIYGPKGVGALTVRRRGPRVVLDPIVEGGGHERGLRSGTLNVAGIVGFGKACALARSRMEADGDRLRRLKEMLRDAIVPNLDDLFVNGDLDRCLPGHLNLSFGHVEGESLLLGLRGIAVSTGSACTSASLEPSHVLAAIGRRQELAQSSIRFSLGRANTEEEVAEVGRRVVETVRRLRELSPLYTMMKEQEGRDAGP